MKKSFEIFLTVLMTAALLAGCGSSNTNEESAKDEPAEDAPAEAAEEKPDIGPEDKGPEGGPGGEMDEEVEVVEQTASDKLSMEDARVTTLHPTLDGEKITVTEYEDVYLENPTIDDQMVSIYVPENATSDSPVILNVNNAGWQEDSYNARTKVEEGKDYVSDSDDDKIGRQLSDGYVIVSYGCRSRSDPETEEGYIGHSPATMTDTKAVIRYLRYNADQLSAGNMDEIFITGTSGGGALSCVIAASGNSEDYFPSLYETGAAGMEQAEDGTYTSTISDAVFGVIAYCPITDLPGADYAYEWTYHDTRARFADTSDETLEISQELKDAYGDYLASLNLQLMNHDILSPDNMKDCIIDLMQQEIEESIDEIGVEQMRADLESFTNDNDVTWITLNDDGTYTYDYDEHLYWLASYNQLKDAPAFSAKGLGSDMSEDTLFGTAGEEYSPFEFYSWNHDEVVYNNVGEDDTGLDWDAYLETDEGKDLLQQMKMTNAVSYLVEGTADAAPYWYVRYGMADRDTSFAVETTLYYSIIDNEDLEEQDFEFAWLKEHAGDYDVQEAYDWLQDTL